MDDPGSPEPLPAYVLAGGSSRRFGSDKARALLQGVPLIVRVARALSTAAEEVIVVAAAEGEYADLGLRTIADLIPGRGPLGGLLTALAHAPASGFILVASCDLLELRPQWLRVLADGRDDATHAVAFRGERWQPFPGLYHTRARSSVEQRVRQGRLAMRELLEEIPAVALPLPSDWPDVVQANTPEDLRLYLARSEGR